MFCARAKSVIEVYSPLSIMRCQRCERASAFNSAFSVLRGARRGAVITAVVSVVRPDSEMISFRPPQMANTVGTCTVAR